MVPERELLNVLAVGFHELTGSGIGTSLDAAVTILDAFAANGWTVTTS